MYLNSTQPDSKPQYLWLGDISMNLHGGERPQVYKERVNIVRNELLVPRCFPQQSAVEVPI
jgi:hypothetical protein